MRFCDNGYVTAETPPVEVYFRWLEWEYFNMKSGLDHTWFWRCRLPERKGHACRVLIRTRAANSCLVEFEDGYRVVTSRWAVRKSTGTT
jgi:hypothetical protein